CIGAKKRVVEGDPDMAHVSTPYVERSNLSIRTQNRRFTRLLNAFSTNSITTFTRWRSTSPSTISAQPQYAPDKPGDGGRRRRQALGPGTYCAVDRGEPAEGCHALALQEACLTVKLSPSSKRRHRAIMP